jgi:hypothetical protein
VPDPEARQRLIFEPQATKVDKSGFNLLNFQRDFVLRGKNQTPALG